MRPFRALILRHAPLAALLVLATLAMRVLVPAGFMPVMQDGRIAMVLCSGSGPVVPAAMPDMAGTPGMAGMAGTANRAGHQATHDAGHRGVGHRGIGHRGIGHHAPEPDGHHTDQPCAYAAVAQAVLGGADTVLLAGAIAFILMRATRRPSFPTRAEPAGLRPPLRGPPVLA